MDKNKLPLYCATIFIIASTHWIFYSDNVASEHTEQEIDRNVFHSKGDHSISSIEMHTPFRMLRFRRLYLRLSGRLIKEHTLMLDLKIFYCHIIHQCEASPQFYPVESASPHIYN